MIIAIIIFAVVMFHLVVGLGWVIYKVIWKPKEEPKVVDSEIGEPSNQKS